MTSVSCINYLIQLCHILYMYLFIYLPWQFVIPPWLSLIWEREWFIRRGAWQNRESLRVEPLRQTQDLLQRLYWMLAEYWRDKTWGAPRRSWNMSTRNVNEMNEWINEYELINIRKRMVHQTNIIWTVVVLWQSPSLNEQWRWQTA